MPSQSTAPPGPPMRGETRPRRPYFLCRSGTKFASSDPASACVVVPRAGVKDVVATQRYPVVEEQFAQFVAVGMELGRPGHVRGSWSGQGDLDHSAEYGLAWLT